jgi:glycosyltransferase involved in cell wall biosynthesis
VIARCLEAVHRDAPEDHRMEVIVAANGCTDRTVARAREASPNAKILDLREGSKTAALNAANKEASRYPRIYLDADVECDYRSLTALAETLREPGVMTAAPAIRMDTSSCDFWTRAYYRVWLRQPYAVAGKGGAGCYGLSENALEEVQEFPPITGDDIWIHTRFPDEQKRFVANDSEGRPVFSVVHPPRTVGEQIRVAARRHNGNGEIRRLYPSPYFDNSNNGGGVGTAVRNGSSPRDILIYSAIKLATRLFARWTRNRGRGEVWTRDLSTREA